MLCKQSSVYSWWLLQPLAFATDPSYCRLVGNGSHAWTPHVVVLHSSISAFTYLTLSQTMIATTQQRCQHCA